MHLLALFALSLLPLAVSAYWQPAPGTTFQIQFEGTINTEKNVQAYDIDLFDNPKSTIDAMHDNGIKVICYISAGTWENWRDDAGDYTEAIKGNNVADWPGEKWVDIRDTATLRPILEARMDLAVEKGCDAIDPDNVDGYTHNTGFPLTSAQQITFNTWLATEAHSRDLAIGLKNEIEQIPDLESVFDFSVNEQCIEYSECNSLTPFIDHNKAVFHIEYNEDPASFCPTTNALGFTSLLKNLNLDAYRIDCLNCY